MVNAGLAQTRALEATRGPPGSAQFLAADVNQILASSGAIPWLEQAI
jgi:hypothetical protein